MRHSFRPFNAEEAAFLSQATGVDFSRTDFASPLWLCVSARDDDGQLMGLAGFEFKNWFDAYFSTAIRDPRCLTRRVLRAMFTAVFSKAARVSAEIEPGNQDALGKAKRMGFEVEGYKRLAIEGRRDAFLLGMTKDSCRFLRDAPRGRQGPGKGHSDGQHTQAA